MLVESFVDIKIEIESRLHCTKIYDDGCMFFNEKCSFLCRRNLTLGFYQRILQDIFS